MDIETISLPPDDEQQPVEEAKAPSTDHTVETIPSSKLLNYVKKLDLIALIGPAQYAEIEQSLRTSLGKPNITVKDVKKYAATNDDIMTRLRQSELGNRAFIKYRDAVSRLKNADRDRMQTVRRGMTQPRRRYLGCLATKIAPKDYEDCLDNFDDVKYDNLALVPTALKKRVYDSTDDLQLKGALAPTVNSRSYHASDLPSGLRHYIQSYPSEFKAYYDERKHELGLMKSVLRNLNPQVKRQLRAHYATNRKMSAADFRSILEGTGSTSSRSRSPKKRIRGRGEPSETASIWTSADTASITHLLD